MVRTLLALGLGLTLAGGAIDSAQGADHEYVGVKKCKSCHKKELIGDQYGKWQEAKHSKAFETLKSDDAVKIGKEKGLSGPPHEAPECLKCHVTAYGIDAAQLPKGKPLPEADGVSCESCHGPGKDYRKKKTMADHDKSVAAGLWEADKDERPASGVTTTRAPAGTRRSTSWQTEAPPGSTSTRPRKRSRTRSRRTSRASTSRWRRR